MPYFTASPLLPSLKAKESASNFNQLGIYIAPLVWGSIHAACCEICGEHHFESIRMSLMPVVRSAVGIFLLTPVTDDFPTDQCCS
jgi:hypothetical protein